ncbi:ABC-type lipoprotein export system ATPase subunit [Paenibacillus sp. W4I10]|nr:ABC-type lipoprotein export system ATPase subunit [Paenibacillus sp. W4I10]
MLQVEQLSHSFRNGQGTVPVLQDINLTIGEGKMVALRGQFWFG